MFERMLGMHTAVLCRCARSLTHCMLEHWNECHYPGGCCNAACFDAAMCECEVLVDYFAHRTKWHYCKVHCNACCWMTLATANSHLAPRPVATLLFCLPLRLGHALALCAIDLYGKLYADDS